MKTETESGYSITLKIKVETVKYHKVATEISLLKTVLFSAPFNYIFNKRVDVPFGINFRDLTGEKVYFKTADDRVMVIFTINFKDSDDIVLGKFFLSEFKNSIDGASSVDFTQKDPPSRTFGS